jgi:hypothetical protein
MATKIKRILPVIITLISSLLVIPSSFAENADEQAERIKALIKEHKKKYDSYPQNIDHDYIDLKIEYDRAGIEAGLASAKSHVLKTEGRNVEATFLIDTSNGSKEIIADLEREGVTGFTRLYLPPISVKGRIPISNLCDLSSQLHEQLNQLYCCAYIESPSPLPDSTLRDSYQKEISGAYEMCSGSVHWPLQVIAYLRQISSKSEVYEFAKLANETIEDDKVNAIIEFAPMNQEDEDKFYSLLNAESVEIVKNHRDYDQELTAMLPIDKLIDLSKKKYVLKIFKKEHPRQFLE